MTGLVMSGSRGAAVALAVVLLIAPFLERSGRIFYALAVGGVLLGVLLQDVKGEESQLRDYVMGVGYR